MAFNYSPKIVTDGLVFAVDAANRKSYPGSGTTWKDLSGNGNDGTLTNMDVTNYLSENGGVFSFDGSDEVVKFGNISVTRFIYTDDFSLETWIYPDSVSSGFRHLIGRGFSDYRLALFNNKISFRVDQNNLITNAGDVPVSQWSHIVATWEANNSTARVYQDGVLQQTIVDVTVDWTHDVGLFQIGNSGNENYYFPGKIAIGNTYSITLSDNQVLQNYNAHKSRFGL